MRPLTLLLLLLAPALCHAQDIWLVKPDGKGIPYFAAGKTVYERLDQVCEQSADKGDSVRLMTDATAGNLDQLDLSKLARFTVAPGCTLTMTKMHDPKEGTPKGPSILLGPNPITISGTIRQRCWKPTEDAALIGWTGDATGGDVTFENAVLDGSQDCDYVIYNWVNKIKIKVTLIDSVVKFARQGIALNANNSEYEVLCKGSKFVGDATGSRTYASTSNTEIDCVLGNVVRGKGTWHVEDCVSKLTGRPENYDRKYGVHRLAAFGNQYDSTSKANKGLAFTAKNVRCQVLDPGNARELYDVDFRYGATWSVDNSAALAQARGGSGPKGEIRAWGVK